MIERSWKSGEESLDGYLHCQQEFRIPSVDPEADEGVQNLSSLDNIINQLRQAFDVGDRRWDVHIHSIFILPLIILLYVNCINGNAGDTLYVTISAVRYFLKEFKPMKGQF